MSAGPIELVWIDRREIISLSDGDDPTQTSRLFATLLQALADGLPIPVHGIPARVLGRDPLFPRRFSIEDARTDPEEGDTL